MSDLPEVKELLSVAVSAVGGAARSGQEDMAQAVADSIEHGRHAIIQAGTGTGKSLAYLVPALRHAVATQSTVVVSTATLALQNQLITRDIPMLCEALAPQLGRTPTAVVVKGRSHYVCKHKLGGGYPDEADGLFDLPELPGKVITTSSSTELGEQVKRVRQWAADTTTGDRDDMSKGVSAKAWAQVSVSARECLGSTCPVAQECFVEVSRTKAHAADIVVTNHAMLAIDAFEGRHILPDHDVLIVDESHELADRVTSVVAGALSVESLKRMLSRTRLVLGESLTLTHCVDDVCLALADVPNGRMIKGIPEPLLAGLVDLQAETKAAMSACGAIKGDQGNADNVAKVAAKADLSEVHDVTERLVAQSQHDVVWAHRDYRSEPGAPAALHIAPLWVGGLLAAALFEDRTVTLTSATLAVGGTFDACLKHWGLEGSSHSFDTLDVASPFDYPKQGILYIARHLQPPGRGGPDDEALAELMELINAAQGGTLGLFSSRAAAIRAAEHAREECDYPILCQGDATMPELVQQFAQDPQACLFGTLTLWQGVDVPGLSSRLVVIDRIPFPRPDDPLASARTDAISAAGGNGFMGVSAQHAGLLLAQGAGRLIRSVNDRGVVAVLDSRLATKRYGGYLRANLPPLWPTHDAATVKAALARLASQVEKAPTSG